MSELGVVERRRVDEPAVAGSVVIDTNNAGQGLAEIRPAKVGDLELEALKRE
jgi:hypothetical protein